MIVPSSIKLLHVLPHLLIIGAMGTNECSYCGQDHGRDASTNRYLPDQDGESMSEQKEPEWQTAIPEVLAGLVLQYALHQHEVPTLGEDAPELYRIGTQQAAGFATVDSFHRTDCGDDIHVSQNGQVATNARTTRKQCRDCDGRGYYPEAMWSDGVSTAVWYGVRIEDVNADGTYRVRWIEENRITLSIAGDRLRPGNDDPANRCRRCRDAGEDPRHNYMQTVRGSQWVATTAEASWSVRILRCAHGYEDTSIPQYETYGVNVGVLREGFNRWSDYPGCHLHAFSIGWDQHDGHSFIGVSPDVEHNVGYARAVCLTCGGTEEGPQPQSECGDCRGDGNTGGFPMLRGLPKVVEGDLVTVTIRQADPAIDRQRELTFKLNGQPVGQPLPLPDGNLALAVGLLQGMMPDGSQLGCSARVESSEYNP